MPEDAAVIFRHLRQYLINDVELLLGQKQGANYTVALLILVGCEALARLLERDDDAIFVERLIVPRGLERAQARNLWTALRHGLAHTFDTQYIKARHLKIELLVSWGTFTHLSIRHSPPGLYLNVRTMWDDFKRVLDELDDQVSQGVVLQGRPPAKWTDKQTTYADNAPAYDAWARKFMSRRNGA